ncbi:class I SAM-dependent methyltransferase [Salinirarus marinus]|uniref:class I SAM-dependent methyltransferase n=1 Tax=Salinirarus marinus TaxID=3068310 RepID=UPI003C6CB7C1
MDHDSDPRTDSATEADSDPRTDSTTEADSDPRTTYDRIASHFSKTREYPWPEIETFLDGASADDALDVGCGNGRHTELLADRATRAVGVDVSRGLLDEARARASARGFDAAFVQGDASALPVRGGRFDLALYVATLHHLRPRERRVRSLDELARALGPAGRALVSVWSVDHERFDATEGFDTTVDWTLPSGETVPRYYHIYDAAEFAADLESSALDVRESFVSSGNCFAVVRPD